ncbi:hypothetical protein B0H11DRAFT_2285383 [Mycena galericulata]|nr:hypothetical protein B0H11DRAFT_2285383 [Mycena galericulata]
MTEGSDLRVGGIYRLCKKIGSGSFGEVYLAINVISGAQVAVKLESVKTRHPRLQYEYKVYKTLEGGPGVPFVRAACFVLDNGDHHILSHSELATWALLASRHEAIIDEPPKDLGINANHGRQKKAKNHRAKADENSNDAPPVWVQNLVPVLGALFG